MIGTISREQMAETNAATYKAVTKVTSVSVHHPKFEKYDRIADNAEKALDDYMGMNNIEYEDVDTGKVV